MTTSNFLLDLNKGDDFTRYYFKKKKEVNINYISQKGGKQTKVDMYHHLTGVFEIG